MATARANSNSSPGVGDLRYQITRTTDPLQPFRWRIVTVEGELLATSRDYRAKRQCFDAIALVMRAARRGQLAFSRVLIAID